MKIRRFGPAARGDVTRGAGRQLRRVGPRTRRTSSGALLPIRRVHRLFKLVPISGDDKCWAAQQTEVSKYGVQVQGIHVRRGESGST